VSTSSTTSSSVTAASRAEILVGLIGSGIGASGSPALHMREAGALGLRLRYDLFDLDLISGGVGALEPVLEEAERAGYAGVNVTHPCKQLVIPHLHELSADAQALGAVNTVVFAGGRRTGHNTDWWGFAEGFRRGLPGAPLHTVTQLGAGGAGSATAYALLKMGVQHLNVYDVDTLKSASLVTALSAQFGAGRILQVADLDAAVQLSDGLINSTPVGMDKYPGLPLPAALLRPSLWVAEIIYFPLETALLKAARAMGCRTVDGGGMVVFQAAEAFRLFTGVAPDAQRMLERFRCSLSQ
jgi:shikimate dehydrogenase